MLFSEAYNKEYIPCIYLENDECLIYPLRPSGCRFQYNFDKLENCDPRKYPNQLEKKGLLSITSLNKKILETILDNKWNMHKHLNLEYGNVTLLTCAYLLLSDQFLNYFGST